MMWLLLRVMTKRLVSLFIQDNLGNLSLKIEDVHQAKDVYDFFGNLFRDHTDEESGMSKSLSRLYGDWDIAKAKIEEVLLRIEKAMGSDWKDAFRTIISVYEK